MNSESSNMPRTKHEPPTSSGKQINRRTAAVKLAAKIFAVLALAIAISYVANWSQSHDASAAAGKIDVLNVGTCYATSVSVFGEDECRDNTADDEDAQYALDSGSGNSGLQNLKLTARPFATYAVDPKTSAEEPRAILMDADLVKISINDPGRDRRTPVLLRAGGPTSTETRITPLTAATVPAGVGCYDDQSNQFAITPRAATIDPLDRELCEVHKIINGTTSSPKDNLYDYTLHQTFVESGEADNAPVEFTQSRASNNLLRVNIPDARAAQEDYLPLHRKFRPDNPNQVTDDTIIRFFGYVVHATETTTVFNCERVSPTYANSPTGATQDDMKICDLSRFVKLDEDIGEGRARGEFGDGSDPQARSAPFIDVGTALAEGDSVRIRYVYYETSEREEIVGGKRSADRDTYHGDDLTNVNPPVFTDDETADADETNPDLLLVQATGDGVGRSQNLWLKETGRFDGTYVGYLRLTDANGNAVVTGGVSEDNWGRETKHAESSELEGAAVLGVQGGPVTIRYKDSDGNTKELRILIDTQPPLVSIDSPEYKANFDEQRIRITGTFNDADSGLRDDSFRLYLDNIDDSNEDGENGGDSVLNLQVKESAVTEGGAQAVGLVTPENSGGVVQLTGDYVGYRGEGSDVEDPTNGLFGILKAPWIFQETSDEDSTNLETITPDSFADGANEGTFDDVARLNIQSTTGDEVPDDELNNQVDFQALVMDIAGNVGFSDSDPAGPTFIHDYGTVERDRKDDRYNVLGWYARHIISVDRLDPRLGRIITGFYDENDDDEPVMDDRGLMLIFDAAVDAGSVDASTFKVELDAVGNADPVDATVEDTTTIGKRVYLLLDEGLLPDATPKLSVNSGRSVRDPAGNSLTSNDPLNGEDDGDRTLEADDGIPPTLNVTLSRGSGTGTGDEDSSNLTMDAIVVRVTSNEDIQGAPYVSFVCDGFTWIDTKGTAGISDDETFEFSNFLANRRGTQNTSQHADFEPNEEKGTCGDDEPTTLLVPSTPTYSRPGNTWEYQWRNNTSGTDTEIPDGDVLVVAFGRDVSAWNDDWDPDEDNPDVGMPSFNWGAATAEFELDTNLGDPSTTNSRFGSVQPRAGSDIFESRPFVLLTFNDASTVTIDSFMIDGTEQEINPLPNNRFLYWPESLSFGKHEVEVEAVDAAANERDFSYEFEVKERTAFTVELLAGWNAVSVPAMPIDPNIDAVFTIEEVDQVVGWDSATPEAPWRIATKVDGVWSTNADNAPLDTILAGKGYWVHANGFVDQTVMLAGNPDRESAGNAPDGPIGITTVKGWNFVGVVDTDGDQTQDGDFGEMLKDSQDEMVDASSYLRNFKQAYTWDPIKNQFNVIEGSDGMSIGDGVWVYYAEDFNIAP